MSNPQSARLKEIVDKFPALTITVLGDLVADEFVTGEISRISREAPVLILQHRETTVVPGGGANAVNNLADLGVAVVPVGIVGDDPAGRALLQLFRKKKIQTAGIVRSKSYSTITKTRIMAAMPHTWRQQVVRIDREPDREPMPAAQASLIRYATDYSKNSNALLISDYGYGAASPKLVNKIRKGASLQRAPLVLDSRHRMLQYSGITAATPNEAEVEEALNRRVGPSWSDLCAAANEVMARMKLPSLVITRGRDGMAVFSCNSDPVDIPIFGSDEIADVTGAGDTVIATFTAALAAGATPREAAHLANYAGGIVVMKRGTATVTRAELLAAIEKSPPKTRPHPKV